MFFKANYEKIPEYGGIPMISTNDIRACIPAPFNGRDTDLLAGEAAFDVLKNTVINPEGMSINWGYRMSWGGNGESWTLLPLVLK